MAVCNGVCQGFRAGRFLENTSTHCARRGSPRAKEFSTETENFHRVPRQLSHEQQIREGVRTKRDKAEAELSEMCCGVRTLLGPEKILAV